MYRFNKSFKDIITKKITAYYGISEGVAVLLSKHFKDIFAPTIIDLFYQKSNSNFSHFLFDLELVDLFSKFQEGETIFNSIKNNIIKENLSIHDSFNISADAEIISDLHLNFRTKYRLENKVYYKDICSWESLVSYLLKIVEINPDLIPEYNNNKGYKVRKYINENNITSKNQNIGEFYYNLGKVLPLLLTIRTIDLIYENIIVKLPNLSLIDLEMILIPKLTSSEDNDIDRYDIYRSNFLCKKTKNKIDFSMYTGSTKKIYSYLSAIILGSNKKPYIKWKAESRALYKNIPILNEKKVKPEDYKSYLIEGYQEGMGNIIINKTKIIECIRNYQEYTRVLFRPTYYYRAALLYYFFPTVYSNSERIETTLHERLTRREFIYADVIEDKNAVISNEVNQLKQGYIPIFYSKPNHNGIYDAFGNEIATFKESPFEVFLEHISNIESFLLTQLDIVRKY